MLYLVLSVFFRFVLLSENMFHMTNDYHTTREKNILHTAVNIDIDSDAFGINIKILTSTQEHNPRTSHPPLFQNKHVTQHVF